MQIKSLKQPNELRTVPIRACLAVLLVFFMAVAGFAQSTNSGDIRGTVTDASGAVIPGVSVTILNVETGVTKQLVTNEAGIYDSVSILPGKYRVTFSKDGFNRLVRDGITLSVGVLAVDAQLTVGAAQQQIEVTAQATALKTETGEQSSVLQTETMATLPNVGQDWSNFTKTLPGASNNPGNGGTGIAVNGNMPYYANFLADGGSTTLPHSANVDVSVFESVAEVQIQTSSFSAQYGIGGVVFNQISKGGTNAFHGSLYEYAQNNFFNARSFFTPTVSVVRRNTFGGSIGGPILKNKMFFYFNQENYRNISNSSPFNSYPTLAARNGDFSDPGYKALIYDPATLTLVNGKYQRSPFAGNQIPTTRMDPVALKIQQFWPTPTLPGLSQNYQMPQQSRSSYPKFFGRLDYNINESNRLTFSITQRDNKGQALVAGNGKVGSNPTCPLNCSVTDISSVNAQVSDVATLTSTTVNEFRFAFTRQGNWYTPLTLGGGYPAALGLKYAKADVFPDVSVQQSATGNFSLNAGTNAIYVENSFQPSDVVTMIKGKHILKFGGEVLMYQDNSTPWGNVQSASLTFNGAFTKSTPFDNASGLGYADFLLGQLSAWGATNSPLVGARQKSPQLFVQDDIKLTPKLTLNLGLRYQLMNPWKEVGNRIGDFNPTLMNPVTNTLGAMWFAPADGRDSIQKAVKNLWQPRFGFAYAPTDKWAIRGGFGVFTYGWSIDVYASGQMGLGTNSKGGLSDSTQINPIFTLSDANPALNYIGASHDPGAYNGQGVSYKPYETPVARNYQWSFSIQRQLPTGLLVEGAYIGSHANGLSNPRDINQVPLSRLGSSNPQSMRPFPQYLGISSDMYDAFSNYGSMQLSLKKRFAHGFSFDTNFTWSKMLTSQDSSGWGNRAGTQNWQIAASPDLNYALSNMDVPFMFKSNAVWQLPFGKNRRFLSNNKLLDLFVGGWQMSGIYTKQSGQPFTATVSGTNNSNSQAGTWYANVLKPGNAVPSNWTLGQYFDLSAFGKPGANTFGNVGRNTLRGPGWSQLDFSMGKTMSVPKLGESGSLQLRFDATNALNHAAFANPNAQIGGSSAGKITSVLSGTNGRTIQLGVRLGF